jgi:hypothetical protein
MSNSFRHKVTLLAMMFFLSTPCLAQRQAQNAQENEVDRLLKSLDGNSWIVGESKYGLTYDTGYLGLHLTTLNSPPNELGNKWYWMIYPLANIDHLWDKDIQPFYPQDEPNTPKSASRASWEHISGFIRDDYKAVFMLLPQFSVVSGRAGARLPGREHYDFGQYLRITEIRVHKDKIDDFEKFVANSFVPMANKYLPQAPGQGHDRLPHYLRAVKIAVTMGKVPQFEIVVQKYLLPAVQKLRGTLFVYHTIYGSEANYLLLFPYEDENDTAGTGDRALSALWQKSYSYFDTLKLDSFFAGLIMGASETIVKVRPELSPRLENKYTKWW